MKASITEIQNLFVEMLEKFYGENSINNLKISADALTLRLNVSFKPDMEITDFDTKFENACDSIGILSTGRIIIAYRDLNQYQRKISAIFSRDFKITD